MQVATLPLAQQSPLHNSTFELTNNQKNLDAMADRKLRSESIHKLTPLYSQMNDKPLLALQNLKDTYTGGIIFSGSTFRSQTLRSASSAVILLEGSNFSMESRRSRAEPGILRRARTYNASQHFSSAQGAAAASGMSTRKHIETLSNTW